jgi:hypothetical protein
MNDPFVALVVRVDEEGLPVLPQRGVVHREPVVLRGDVALARAQVDALHVIVCVVYIYTPVSSQGMRERVRERE